MRVYADNAATTKLSPAAKEAMLPYFDEIYGNPSTLYTLGQEAAEHLLACRTEIAQLIGAADPREIVFTSGGSEADNQAIISAARNGARKGKKHLISTKFEHHAVLHTLDKLRKEGFDVTPFSCTSSPSVPSAHSAANGASRSTRMRCRPSATFP